MGLLRYVLQGAGWRVGREVAEEAIDEARARQQGSSTEAPSKAELRRSRRRDAAAAKKMERQRKKAAAADAAKAKADEAEFEREFERLKRRVERDA